MRRAVRLLPLLLLVSGCVVCVAKAAEPRAHYVIVEGYRLPDPRFNPGAVTDATKEKVCATKWGIDDRHVTEKMKDGVCALYGVHCVGWRKKTEPACCEVDHIVSRELGGADVFENLFPQPWRQAHMKDRLENRLHKEVCAGAISLHAAQIEIMTNWWAAFKKRFGGK